MTSRKFLFTSLYVAISLFIIFIFINFSLNEFGLFGDGKDKKYRVYALEKSSKYLFSFNYIPNNFNGILVGSSSSSLMMDTKNIKNNKIYNLSMNGANISEIKKVVDNILKFGDIKTFIISFVPSLTKTSGMKSGQINSKEYYGTLQSDFVIRYYYYKFKALRKGNKDIFYSSYNGYTDNSFALKNHNPTKEINREHHSLITDNDSYFDIDNIAFNQLNEMLKKVREKNIQIFAYYYPFPKRLYEHVEFNPKYRLYKNKIDSTLDMKEDIVVNFNQDKYDYIRDIDENYFNTHHLSKSGASKIFKVINNKLKNNTFNVNTNKDTFQNIKYEEPFEKRK